MGTGSYLQGAYGANYRIDPEEDDDEAKAGTHNACWVAASESAKNGLSKLTLAQVKHSIPHEIGHVLVGEGHCDDPDGPGPAQLPGTNHSKRLMTTGLFHHCGHLLVKAEWDKAEKWLWKTIDEGEPQ